MNMRATAFCTLLIFIALAAIAADESGIDVSVTDAAGQPVAGAYVAIVDDMAPWSSPRQEAIGPNASWDVPPGAYGVVAGAPGYATQFELVTVTPGGRARAQLMLKPLGQVRGTIRSARGTPMAGTHVSWRYVNGSKALSPLATEHLRANFETTTDASANFVLRVPLDEPVDMLAHAGDRKLLLQERVSASLISDLGALTAGVEVVESAFPSSGVRLFLTGVRDQAGITVWRIKGDEIHRVDTRAQVAAGGTLLHANGLCVAGSTYFITTRDDIRTHVVEGGCDLPLRTIPRPSGLLYGRLRPPARTTLPATGTIRCGGALESPFPLTADTFRARVITGGCKQPSLVIGDFAPIRLERVTAGQSVDLGTVALQYGGMARIRVTGDDGTPIAGAKVTVVRRADLQALTGRLTLSAVVPLAEASTNTEGRADVSGLPADEIVFAMQRVNEHVPAFSDVYAVGPGDRLRADLVLPRVAALTVHLNVPAALAAVSTMTVELQPEGFSVPGTFVPAIVEGTTARVEGLPPGQWLIKPSVRIDGGLLTPTEPKRVTVWPGANEVLTVDVKTSFYRGRVTRAGAPVRGAIAFRSASASRTARLDADGKFSVLLDVPGEYRVRVQEAGGSANELPEPVRFGDVDNAVHIEMPEGTIGGVVVDENGSAVPRAQIAAELARRPDDPPAHVYARSEADGTFEMTGVSDGLWRVVAELGDAASDAQPVSMGGAILSPIRLQLRRQARVSVRVLSESGQPVTSALVALTPAPASNPFPRQSVVKRTGGDGVVEFLLHSRPGALLDIAVVTPAGVVFSVRRPSAETITLETPALTGALVLRRAIGGWTGMHARLVAEDGSSFGPRFGGQPDPASAQALIFERLPAGMWRYYEARSAEESTLLEAGLFDRVRPVGTSVVRPQQRTEIMIDGNGSTQQ